MLKRRSIIITLAILFIALIFGFIAPWGIGLTLHHNVKHRFKKLDRHPQYRFALKKYEQGIYQSHIVIEITSKSLYKDKPKVHFIVEEDIQHGPLLIDLTAKQAWFKLAKIHSRILPQDTAFIQFDQKEIQLASFVNYRWKENFLTQIDKITGRFFLTENKPCQLEINTVEIKGDLGFSTLNLFQNIAIKEILFSLNANTTVKMNQVRIDNHLTATHSVLDNSEDNLNCDSIDMKIKKHKISFLKPVVHIRCHTESKNNLLEIQSTFDFEKMLVNDKPYGPLKSRFAILHFPKIFVEDVEALEKIMTSKKMEEMSHFFKNALQQDNLYFTLQEFNLHVPGGILSLKGDYTLIPQANESLPFRGEGKFLSRIPKYALYQHLSPSQMETFNSFLMNGYFIEAEDSFDGFFVLKDKNLYINGSNPNDPLFAKMPSIFKHPLTKEQNLYLALMAEDNEMIRRLVKEQVNLRIPVSEGKYPIHLAAYMGNHEAIKLFLASEVPVDLVDGNGNTPLYWAARAGHRDVVNTLMNDKATINAKNAEGWTPLQEAAENGHTKIVTLLLEKGAEVNAQDNDGRTALFWAAKEGHLDIIKLLLNKGANPSIYNVRNLTPLDIAREYQRKAVVAELENK